MLSALLYATSLDVPVWSQIYVGQAGLPHLPDEIYLRFLFGQSRRMAGSPCISLPLPLPSPSLPFPLENGRSTEAPLKMRLGSIREAHS